MWTKNKWQQNREHDHQRRHRHPDCPHPRTPVGACRLDIGALSTSTGLKSHTGQAEDERTQNVPVIFVVHWQTTNNEPTSHRSQRLLCSQITQTDRPDIWCWSPYTTSHDRSFNPSHHNATRAGLCGTRGHWLADCCHRFPLRIHTNEGCLKPREPVWEIISSKDQQDLMVCLAKTSCLLQDCN